jgi:hypothetical protein
MLIFVLVILSYRVVFPETKHRGSSDGDEAEGAKLKDVEMTERGSYDMSPVQMAVTEETQGETKGECAPLGSQKEVDLLVYKEESTKKDIKERIIGHIFDLLDADKSGVLDKKEVGETLASWGLRRFKAEERKDDVLEEFWAFDEDRDGTLSREEFHNMWKKKKVDFLARVEARLIKLKG